jgi:hypothetical protein
VRPDQHRAHSAEENCAGYSSNFRSLHAVAEEHEGIRTHLVGRQVIGLVEIHPIDFVAGDEGVDLEGLVAGRHGSRDFVRFENYELAVLDLVAFHLIIALDRIAGFAVDELALDPITCLAIERVERNALRR